MIFEVFLFLILGILILLLIHERRTLRLRSMGELIPGPKRMPIVGNFIIGGMPRNGAGMLEMRRQLIKEFGQTSRFWMGNDLYIVTSDPDDVEAILNKTTDLDKDKMYKFFKPWLGSGLLISGGEKWYRRRKAITPAFHFKILEQFIDIFNKNGEILVEQLKKVSGTGLIDIQPYISRCTLDIICETAMGVEVHAQTNSTNPYVNAVRSISKILFDRMRSPWQWNDLFYAAFGKKKQHDKLLKIIHDFTNGVIKEKKKENAEAKYNEDDEFIGVKNKTAFLELLLNLSKKPDTIFKNDEDIREEVDTFMFEGHDTTTSALSSILHVLGKHQDVQEKVYNETMKFIGTNDSSNLTYRDLQEMKYLECVIKECMRLYPPVPAIARDLKEDIKLPSGFIAPKDSSVLISLFFLHRNTKCFDQPEVFNPDNFLPENSVGRHPFAYAPFSAGQRNCIGQKFVMLEIKSTLVKLLCKYRILYPGEEWDIIPNPTLTLQSINGFKIKLVQRDV